MDIINNIICHFLASKMKFKQIACLYLVLHVSHLMVMSRSLDEQAMGTDISGVAEEDTLQEIFGKEFGDLLKSLILTERESKAGKYKVEKSTCALPDLRRIQRLAFYLLNISQELIDKLFTLLNDSQSSFAYLQKD